MIDPSKLTPADLKHIYNLVIDLIEVIRSDDAGITLDLIDETLIVAEILQLEGLPND